MATSSKSSNPQTTPDNRPHLKTSPITVTLGLTRGPAKRSQPACGSPTNPSQYLSPLVFENEYSGVFFNSAWRRFRKRNAYPTAIAQNVEYLLNNVLASTMLSNSEFIVMLNQAVADHQKLVTLLNISQEEMSYITNANAGCGLVRYGSSLVPFVNRFNKNTKLYRLMTTKPGE